MALISISSATELRVVSLNVNYANTNAAETMATVLKQKPDLIFLQESNAAFEKWSSKDYPHSWFTTDKENVAGGFGILSKYPITEKEWIPKIASFGAQMVLIEAESKLIQLFNLHLNPAGLPESGDYGQAMHRMMVNGSTHIKELKHIMAKRKKGMPVIVAGDLNGKPRMAAVRTLTERMDFTDSMAGDEESVSWTAEFKKTKFQARFDYILCSPELKPSDAKVITIKDSDHKLVSAKLELKK